MPDGTVSRVADCELGKAGVGRLELLKAYDVGGFLRQPLQ